MTDYGPGTKTQDATPKKDRFGVKKMTIRKTLIATLVLLGAPAFALIDAIELTPDNMILPATTNGMMTFQPCVGECDKDHKRARLTANTKFVVDGRAVKFEEFRRGHAAMRRSKDSYALVSYETETNTVTTIEISR
jgi:hypothetical protein